MESNIQNGTDFNNDPEAVRSKISTTPTGHCLDEPGTIGWKTYQAERQQNMKALKEDKLKCQRVREQLQKIQEKVDYLNSASTLTGVTSISRLLPECEKFKPKNATNRPSHPSNNKNVRFANPEVLHSPNFSLHPLTGTFIRRSLRDHLTTEILAPKASRNSTRWSTATNSYGSHLNTIPLRKKLQAKEAAKKSRSKTAGSVSAKKSAIKPKELKIASTSSTAASGTGTRKKRKAKSPKKKPSRKLTAIQSNLLTAGLAETQITIPNTLNSLETVTPTVGTSTRITPPRITFVPNTPFPGTPEWDKYWKGYHLALDKYDKQMDKFSKGIDDYNISTLNEYKKEAKRISKEEKFFRTGLNLLGSSFAFELPKPPPIQRIPLGEELKSFNGYILNAKNIEGTISNLLGQETGLSVEIKIGNVDPDTLHVERDNYFFTLSLRDKRHFLHICVPPGKSPKDVIMYKPIGGIITIEGP